MLRTGTEAIHCQVVPPARLCKFRLDNKENRYLKSSLIANPFDT